MGLVVMTSASGVKISEFKSCLESLFGVDPQANSYTYCQAQLSYLSNEDKGRNFLCFSEDFGDKSYKVPSKTLSA